MNKSIITTIVCLAATLLFQLSAQAEDVLLTCNADGTTVMDVGDIVGCTIDPVADVDAYEFSATANDIILLTLTDLTFSNFDPCIRLFDSNMVEIDSWCADETGVEHKLLLNETGQYRFFITDSGNNQAGNYRVALQRISPAPPEARTLVFSEVTAETINPVPDSDVFLIDGNIDDWIRITLTDLTFSNFDPCIRLFDPNMVEIDSWCADETGVAREFTLATTGNYTVVINDNGDNQSGNYNLGLQCIFGPCEDSPPPPTCGGQPATIIGTEDDNVIIGTEDDDVIVGLGGNDTIYGLGGKDRICGGSGDDTIYGGDKGDRIWGQDGNDILFGDNGNDALFGNLGNDSLDGGWHSDQLFGGVGNDTLRGGGGDDFLSGQGNVDVCDGSGHDSGDSTDGSCEITVNVEAVP